MRRRLTFVFAVAAIAVGGLIPAGAAFQGNPAGVWTWPGAVVLTVNTSPEPTPGWVRSDPYLIDCPMHCVRSYDRGAVVRLTAHPSKGLSFSRWTGTACAGQGQTCTLTMTESTEVTAEFSGTLVPEPPTTSSPTAAFKLTLTLQSLAKTVSVTGKASCVHPGGAPPTVCTYSFPPGTMVTLTQTAGNAGVWTGDCVGGGACVLTMDANKAATRLNPA